MKITTTHVLLPTVDTLAVDLYNQKAFRLQAGHAHREPVSGDTLTAGLTLAGILESNNCVDFLAGGVFNLNCNRVFKPEWLLQQREVD